MKISENHAPKELKKKTPKVACAGFGSVFSWQGQKESNSQHTVLETVFNNFSNPVSICVLAIFDLVFEQFFEQIAYSGLSPFNFCFNIINLFIHIHFHFIYFFYSQFQPLNRIFRYGIFSSCLIYSLIYRSIF